MKYDGVYAQWCQFATSDPDLVKELASIAGDEAAIEDRFYQDLAFGTGGLRGVIGAGTNRMNIYSVARATQGFSNYLLAKGGKPKVAIGYDSRIKSDLFARTAAEVFAGNGIHVSLYDRLTPTPSLSFAVRHLGCDGGVVVTASHNPGKYNGYKVYGPDGCQITTQAAADIQGAIGRLPYFDQINRGDFDECAAQGLIEYIGDEVLAAFQAAVQTESMLPAEIARDVKIVYTPLNGAGISCVPQCLAANGFTNITLVEEQKTPDGNFPTCPFPNPEIREALECGLKCAKETGSDLLLATDPDCDRVGVAVRSGDDFVLISGNQMGVLLLDFICKMRTAAGTMPKNPVAIKTIVTTDLTARVAEHHGVELRNVLTGFKYIGEQIGQLETQGAPERYILGFEESYGYLSGSYVRDKDGVNASLLICEMFAWYKAQGQSLLDVLGELYAQFGFFTESLTSLNFEGSAGFATMQAMMDDLRANTPASVLGSKVTCVADYEASIARTADGAETAIDLPKSNVIKLWLEDGATIVARPSGTEPKIKLYFSAPGQTKEASEALAKALDAYFTEWANAFASKA